MLRDGQVGFSLVTCAAIRTFDEVLDSTERQDRNDEEKGQKAHPLLDGERSSRTAIPAAPRFLCETDLPTEKVCSYYQHIALRLPMLWQALCRLLESDKKQHRNSKQVVEKLITCTDSSSYA
jgi:hypothetical protein